MARMKNTTALKTPAYPAAKRKDYGFVKRLAFPTAIKKPRRRFKQSTIALRKINRDQPDSEDIRDPEFVLPKLSSAFSPSSNTAPRTRGGSRIFFKCANQVPVLPSLHTLKEEAMQYGKFVTSIGERCPMKQLKNGPFFETDQGIWITTIVRYKNKAMKDATVSQHEPKEFWRRNNGCPSTIGLDVMQTLRTTSKPITLVLGNQQMNQPTGHCVAVVIVSTPEGRRAYIKDSLAINEARVLCLVYPLMKAIRIKEVQLVGMFDFESEVTHTDCIREAFKVVGDILDGNYFWERKLHGFVKTFNTKTFKQVKL